MINVAKKAAKEGGKIILKYFDKDLKRTIKKDQSYVTLADKESEQVIKKIILEKYPDHAFVGEETGKAGENEFIWHVDPLDGTSNFVNKIPYCCVSIGLEKNGKFIIGVIYNPFTDELFYSEEGGVAYLNKRRIYVNKLRISDSIILLGSNFRNDVGIKKLSFIKKIKDLTHYCNAVGSSALQLTEVARGTTTTALLDALHSYDFVAGVAIVRGAGGIITDQYGKGPTVNSKLLVASNNTINHKKIISITAKIYKNYKGI